MKKFINDPFDAVDEMLEGFLAVHGRYVRKLEDVRTVVRTDAPVKGKVAVITGGSVGIGFSSPSNLARDVVGQLRQFGIAKRGWIGVLTE